MQKNLKGTLGLLAVFGLLLGWYLIYEQKVRPDQDKKKEQAKQLVTLERDQIQEIEFERFPVPPPEGKAPPPSQLIRLKKTGSEWHIAAPIDALADNAAVGTLLATLTSTQSERVVQDSPKDLEPFGLKAPQLILRARTNSDAPWAVVRVGSDTTVGFNSYVQLGDSPAVHTASRNIKTTFEKDVDALRDKRIFTFTRSDVQEMEYAGPKESFVLQKRENDEWWLARSDIPADGGEVNKAINALVDARAKAFLAEDGSGTKYGLGRGALQVTLGVGRDKPKITLQLGKTGSTKDGEKYFLRSSEKKSVFEVEKEVWEKVARQSADFRSLFLAKFNRFNVSRIRLDHTVEPVNLIKSGADWKVEGDEAFSVDTAAVDNLLTALQDTKLTEYVAQKSVEAELKTPALVVRLFEKTGDQEKEKLVVTFARRKADKRLVAIRTGLNLGMVIKDADFTKLNVAKKDFAKKEAPKAPPEEKASSEKGTG